MQQSDNSIPVFPQLGCPNYTQPDDLRKQTMKVLGQDCIKRRTARYNEMKGKEDAQK